MTVLQDAFCFGRPYDHSLVFATGRKAFAILGVGDGVERVLVPLERVQQVALDRVVDEHAAADGGDELRARRVEGEVVNARFNALALGHLVGP